MQWPAWFSLAAVSGPVPLESLRLSYISASPSPETLAFLALSGLLVLTLSAFGGQRRRNGCELRGGKSAMGFCFWVWGFGAGLAVGVIIFKKFVFSVCFF